MLEPYTLQTERNLNRVQSMNKDCGKALLTQQRLRELLSYDPETGDFRWLVSRGKVRVGGVAGTPNAKGHLQIRIDGVKYYAHRLAWLWAYGVWPLDQIDHVNAVKDDNRLSNLRAASHAENARNRGAQKNNSSGLKCVYQRKDAGKWQASIRLDGKLKHLGTFTSAESASAAYAAAAHKYHGDFARTS